MQESVLQRVKEVVSAKAKNVSQFSKMIGIGQNTLNQYIIGQRKLSLEAVMLILNTFEDISAEWLLRGKGNMIEESAITEHPIMTNHQIVSVLEQLHIITEKYTSAYNENLVLKQELERLRTCRAV